MTSNVFRVPYLRKERVNFGLEMHGAPYNNSSDIFQQVKPADTISKAMSYYPTRVPTDHVLEMATVEGTKAPGLEYEI